MTAPLAEVWMSLSKVFSVLLVDDDAHNRKIFETVLRHAGFEVRLASAGDEAMRLAKEAPPE